MIKNSASLLAKFSNDKNWYSHLRNYQTCQQVGFKHAEICSALFLQFFI